jgi:hypothetical protein
MAVKIGTAPSQRGDLAFARFALKPGDNDHAAGMQQFMDGFGGDIVNLGFRVDAVGHNARLRAGQRNRRHPQRVQGDGGQGNGLLLAGGQEHVHLALAWQGRNVFGQRNQAVRDSAHRGNHHDDPVAALVVLRHPFRDVFDAVRVGYRRPAVFLNNQCHT